eukprot:jgi/Botrbrau1/16572/Bobra.0068s0003.2
MGTGYLDALPAEFVRAPRKQVLVVVTAKWEVLCFDHNLNLMWKNSILADVPHIENMAAKEVAIHISNHSMVKGDRGVVVVGASAELGAVADLADSVGGANDDVLNRELALERARERFKYGKEAGAHLADIDQSVHAGEKGIDITRHFSYYAFSGSDGALRWKHEPEDFHRNVGELREEIIPQHNYRLDAKSLNSRHYGEVSCRNFRESILAALPHRWDRRSDTRFQLAHFVHHREAKPLGERSADGLRPPPSLSRRSPPHLASKTGHHGIDHKNPVAKVVSKVAERATKGGGLGEQKHTLWAPNVIVAHLEEGIEAVHLYTGRTICKLHLPSPGLHVDMDADGVPDHMQAHAGRPRMLTDTGHKHVPPCWATATSGVPPKDPFFNGSICRLPLWQAGQSWQNMMGTPLDEVAMQPVDVISPAFLPIPGPAGHFRNSWGLAVFLNSRGEVTAFNPYGDKAWQVPSTAGWALHAINVKATPTLKPMPLRTHAVPSVILVAGDTMAQVLSEHGHQLDSLILAGRPILPLQAVDFNGDTLTDVILVARNGVYGYGQIRHPTGVPFAALLACLIVAMGVVYFTQQTGTKSSSKGSRATDRVD